MILKDYQIKPDLLTTLFRLPCCSAKKKINVCMCMTSGIIGSTLSYLKKYYRPPAIFTRFLFVLKVRAPVRLRIPAVSGATVKCLKKRVPRIIRTGRRPTGTLWLILIPVSTIRMLSTSGSENSTCSVT